MVIQSPTLIMFAKKTHLLFNLSKVLYYFPQIEEKEYFHSNTYGITVAFIEI